MAADVGEFDLCYGVAGWAGGGAVFGVEVCFGLSVSFVLDSWEESWC